MKKYKLEDLDLSEKGNTDCRECPLSSGVSRAECSKLKGRTNDHLLGKGVDCFEIKLKLKV